MDKLPQKLAVPMLLGLAGFGLGQPPRRSAFSTHEPVFKPSDNVEEIITESKRKQDEKRQRRAERFEKGQRNKFIGNATSKPLPF